MSEVANQRDLLGGCLPAGGYPLDTRDLLGEQPVLRLFPSPVRPLGGEP
jgi:hypothetical protein